MRTAAGPKARGRARSSLAWATRSAPPRQRGSDVRLYVGPMDATVVGVQADGRVKLEHEEWSAPTLQERRAIIYEAQKAIEEMREWVEFLTLQDGRTAGLKD